jgi:hypothetical protein
MIRPAAFLLCVAAGAAEANTVGCGGNSYSFAEVVTAPRARVSKDARPPARRGEPILVVPHSLCADLIEERGPQYEPSQVDVELPLPGGRRPRR